MPAELHPVWKADLPSDGVGGIAAAQGLVIVSGRDPIDRFDYWAAFDALTGEPRWKLVYPAAGQLDYGNSPRATPLIVDDQVFLLGALGHLHAVDLTSGKVQWRKDLAQEFGAPRGDWGLTGSPLWTQGKLIVQPGGKEASLIAIEPRTGEVLWKVPGKRAGHASLIAMGEGERCQIVGYDAQSLGGWRLRDGERLWTLTPPQSGDFNVPTPLAVAAERLVVSTENNGTRLYAIQTDGKLTTEPLARCTEIAPDAHTPVQWEDRIYALADGLTCVSATDLHIYWHLEEAALEGYGSLIAAPQGLLATTEKGELMLVRDHGERGEVISRLALGKRGDNVLSHPALWSHFLFARVGNSLLCVDLKE